MTQDGPSFFQRLSIAVAAFRRSLKDAGFARRIEPLLERPGDGERTPGGVFTGASPDAALQILGLLQQHGRLIDFLEEELDGFPDQEVGAAARVVHQGCRKVLREYLTILPVREEAEGGRVQVEAGFDPAAIRLTGNLVGQPPFNGTLVHRGWRAAGIELPQVAAGHDFSVLASAEVEL